MVGLACVCDGFWEFDVFWPDLCLDNADNEGPLSAVVVLDVDISPLVY